MQIVIIGAGNVGGALGAGWAKASHTITYGVSAPDNPKHQPVAKAAGDAVITSVAAAINGADVIVLATPWDAVPAILAACGDLSGRVLIDVTNLLQFGADGLELAIGFNTSGAEQVAALAKGAAVVKTMNQVGFAVMAAASNYVTPLGFDARDAGPLKIARLLESFATLWIDQVMVQGAPGTNAFAFLSRRQA